MSADQVAQAEAHLVGLAAHHHAKDLTILGRALSETIAPHTASAYEAKKVEAEERRAAERPGSPCPPTDKAACSSKGKLPDLHAAMLKKILHAHAAPRHQAAVAAQQGQPAPARVPSPQRLGKAFCDLLESLTARNLPQAGGTGATVVVTMDLNTLMGGVHAARLDTGEPISPGTARRLACQAGLVPAVLGTRSVPLDLGRRTRFHTTSQRIAIAPRDAGCTTQGCDWPPACARSTTTHPGPKAASPTSTTPGCSAPTTTPEPTTPPTTTPDTRHPTPERQHHLPPPNLRDRFRAGGCERAR